MGERAEQAMAAGKALIEALKQRDPEAARKVLHDDIVVEVPYPLVPGENTTGARRSTGQAVFDYIQDAKDRTREMTFSNEVWRKTDDGLAIYEADGAHTLSDGRIYLNHFLFMFEVADGKIIRWVEYLNPVAAMRAFGGPLETIP